MTAHDPAPLPHRLTFTVEEAANELRCHRNTVDLWINQGRIRSFKLGRLRRITRDDLIAFIHSCPTTTTRDQASDQGR